MKTNILFTIIAILSLQLNVYAQSEKECANTYINAAIAEMGGEYTKSSNLFYQYAQCNDAISTGWHLGFSCLKSDNPAVHSQTLEALLQLLDKNPTEKGFEKSSTLYWAGVTYLLLDDVDNSKEFLRSFLNNIDNIDRSADQKPRMFDEWVRTALQVLRTLKSS